MADDLHDKACIDPNPRPRCTHRCLLPENHEIGEGGSHFYGYSSEDALVAQLTAEIERLRATIEHGLGFAHIAGLFNGGMSEGNLVHGFMEWAEAHNDTVEQNKNLRRCLKHAIDHMDKWGLFTAEEKQAVLTEYKEALDD